MAYTLTTSHDITRPAWVAGYRVHISETSDALSPLVQVGPVYNNWINYVGVFATHREAVAAALAHLDRPCTLAQRQDWVSGEITYRVETASRLRHVDGYTQTVAGSRTGHGTYIAAEG